MQASLIILCLLLVSACSIRDTVSMDSQTKQRHDLNDLDNDGVIVAREFCNDTLLGANIDNDGCAKTQSSTERTELKILFANDSYYIDSMYYDQIEAIAIFMDLYPDTEVMIEGHSSKTGDYEHNLVLSENRANAVSRVLMDNFDISPDRLSTIGYGFDRPVSSAYGSMEDERNRRVIAELKGEDMTTEIKWNIYTVDSILR